MPRNPLAPFSERAYAVLRIVAGLLFAFHGAQKLFGLLTGNPPPPLASQMGIGGVLELVCGTLIAIGFLTPVAAFIASGEMAVAYIQFHWKFQFDAKFFPTQQGGNGGELALLYCFLWLFVACRGAGPWSVDGLLMRRPSAPPPPA